MKIDKDHLYYGYRVGTPEENLAYNQGLEDAWDIARLIIFRDDDAKSAFGDNPIESIFESMSAARARERMKSSRVSIIESTFRELISKYGEQDVIDIANRLLADNSSKDDRN